MVDGKLVLHVVREAVGLDVDPADEAGVVVRDDHALGAAGDAAGEPFAAGREGGRDGCL